MKYLDSGRNFDSDNNSVGSSASPKPYRNTGTFTRSYKACLSCRKRKVKCDLGPIDAPHDPPCVRCRRENKPCEFVESRRGGAENIQKGLLKKQKHQISNSFVPVYPQESNKCSNSVHTFDSVTSSSPITSKHHSGSDPVSVRPIVPASSGDKPVTSTHIDTRTFSTTLPNYTSLTGGPPASMLLPLPYPSRHSAGPSGWTVYADGMDMYSKRNTESSATSGVVRRELHNPADAIDILAQAASHLPIYSQTTQSQPNAAQDETRPTHSTNGDQSTPHTIADTKSANRRSKGSITRMNKVLTDTYAITKKLLTVEEAIVLISFFYEKLHPFYPFVPERYRDPNVLATNELLLDVILTISARYYDRELPENLTGENEKYKTCPLHAGYSRNLRIHSRLWIISQSLFSHTVWAEASTRSLGTVVALLLTSEWNPRAIHKRWKDYANDGIAHSSCICDEMKTPEVSSVTETGLEDDEQNSEDEDQDGTPSKTDKFSSRERQSLVNPSSRSNRMAWIMVGTAVRLAEDIGSLKIPEIYIACHLSELIVALRLGRSPMLNDVNIDELPFELSSINRVRMEIIQLLALGYKALYKSREMTRQLIRTQGYIAVLQVLQPYFSKWITDHNDILRREAHTMTAETLWMEFQYAKLYVFSIALSPTPNDRDLLDINKVNDKFLEYAFVEEAIIAAKEVISTASRIHHVLGMLRYMPVRWVTHIMHAAVFLLKAYVLGSRSGSTYTGIVFLLRKLAQILREASPDEVHVGQVYARILDQMCEVCDNDRNSGEAPEPEISIELDQNAEQDVVAQVNSADFVGNNYNAQHEVIDRMLAIHDTNAELHQVIDTIVNNGRKHGIVSGRETSCATPRAGSSRGEFFNLGQIPVDFGLRGAEGLGFIEPLVQDFEQQWGI
ncbi:hypothetical protein CANCADRAFT_113569 [Tortispora caseinolytica NRRL Y-17796]|uniref:Zn(2)-C6 fungal-type domain-containing protein n=1 Tax=Tortispora caseinolytica NRRL Y-17796 TaxID=767744 RepID=A0A1E4TGY3_9ASCO|nr:hypothetical protein CANCADRAFT_113569 [Tortispora caseinolytica NRRL Y-17796]